jgi:hypothetical protein
MNMATASGSGAEAAAALNDVQSPETYIGYDRAENFTSPGGFARDQVKSYGLAPLSLNDWALEGPWVIGRQSALAVAPGTKISFRFHARDLHLVLGPAGGGKPVRFRVTVDGQMPSGDAGVDVAADGSGIVKEQRLYQLVRQKGEIRDRTFTIEFLDPGVEAFSFTFG